LTSGATITITHYYIKSDEENSINEAIKYLFITLYLAFLFILIQLFEYFSAPFDISDGAYASVFYICTGFHGFHVIIGSIFIAVMLIRLIKFHFSRMHHFGFEAAS
jgi:heme/copper-type cytochrome/quinol oxidase subunit 3